MIYKYSIPGYYLFHSRLKRKSEIVSLLYVYPIFLFLIIFFWGDFQVVYFTITFVVAFLAWLSFYEIGYLENDVFTIKKETNPTLRIPDKEIDLIEKHYRTIISLRCLLGICFILILTCFNSVNWLQLNILGFISFIVIARFAFYLHNTIRSRWNILTYFMLSFSKYLSLAILFSPNLENFQFILIVILILFPIPRTIEHAAKIKYGIKFLGKHIGNLDRFRVVYYFLISLILLYFYIRNSHETFILISFLGGIWFFFFRLMTFLLIRLGSHKRTNFSSHKWD